MVNLATDELRRGKIYPPADGSLWLPSQLRRRKSTTVTLKTFPFKRHLTKGFEIVDIKERQPYHRYGIYEDVARSVAFTYEVGASI